MFHRHTKRIGMPRGMLAHISLILLRDGPKSGSELSDLIEEYTEWRPSPGSIYPLLKGLQHQGLIVAHEDEDPSLKRFELTEKGVESHGDNERHNEEFRRRNRSVQKIYLRLMNGMPVDTYTVVDGLMAEMYDTWKSIDENQVTLFMDILEKTTAELKKIGKKQDE